MVSSFKGKFKTQNPKSSKQMYSFFPKFNSEISYISVALEKNKLASGWPQNRIMHCKYRF